MTPVTILMLLAGAGVLTLAAITHEGDGDDGEADDDTARLTGTAGDDMLRAADADLPQGGSDDPVTVVVDGGDGNDTIYGGLRNSPLGRPDIDGVVLNGGAGDDLIWSLGRDDPTVADGGEGNDTVVGLSRSWSPETLRGGEGDDSVWGAADTLEGGAGADWIEAGPVDVAVTTEPLDRENPTDSVIDPDLDDSATVMTGGEGRDGFTLSAGYWTQSVDDIDPAVDPGGQMNDVVITDFDPTQDRLILPERVGAFHSRQYLYPEPGDILNVTADFDGITAAPTEDGLGTVLTVTYLPAQQSDMAALTVRITLETAAGFDPAQVGFRSDTPVDYDAVIARAGL